MILRKVYGDQIRDYDIGITVAQRIKNNVLRLSCDP
jgi:hypothetical protein